MIDVIDSIIQTIKTVEDLEGRVYRRWPKVKGGVAMPACLVSHISRQPVLTDANGSEIRVRCTYSIDINTKTQNDADSIAEDVIDALAGYNFHTTGYTDIYDEVLGVYRVIMTVSGTVDKRGNTFTQ